MERTYRFKQADIVAAVDVGVAKKAVALSLDTYGPYRIAYSRNGRHMLMGGEKGHVAVVDWNTNRLSAEFHVKETVRDVSFLHSASLFAVAQKKYAYIYDARGTEVHKLKSHVQPIALDFLPYHFLLCSLGAGGYIKWQDVSTGALAAEHSTHAGANAVMRQNPWNAVMCVGQGSGMVSMWTPNMSSAVVKIIAHRGPVTALAVDTGGRYMVTSGGDGRLKVWDVRKFQADPLFNYFLPLPATSIDVSQRGMVAVGFGSHVQIWGRDFASELSTVPVTAPLALARASRAAASAGAGASASAAAVGGAGAASSSGKHIRFDEDTAGGDGDDDDAEGDGKGDSADAAGATDGDDAAGGAEEDGDGEGDAPDGIGARRPGRDSGIYLPGRRPAPELPRGVRKARAPYLKHEFPGNAVLGVRFRPYDDVLAVGHGKGVTTLIIPGAGEPNYDSREADPFQTKKGRAEAEVHALLDKLPPTMISLDPSAIGGVDTASPALREKERAAAAAAALTAGGDGAKARKRRRKAKNANVITARSMVKNKMLTKHIAEKEAAAAAAEAKERGDDAGAAAGGAGAGSGLTSALSRFYGKRRV